MTTTECWHDALASYREWWTAAGRSPGSVRIHCHYVRALSRRVERPAAATYADLVAFLGTRPDWSPETRYAARSALRSFFGWAYGVGVVEANPAERLPSVKRPAGQPRPAPLEAVQGALSAATERDRLMVLLAVTAGLRRAEIAQVHRRDLVEGVLRVRGKGGRVRSIPLRNRELVDAIRGADGYLFPGSIDGHLSPDRVGHVVASLLGAGWTAHTLRHRFATVGYAAQRDILAMQQLLGHAKPETTARYAAVPLDALDAAVTAAAEPYEAVHVEPEPAPCPVVPLRSTRPAAQRRPAPAVNRDVLRAVVDAAPGPLRAALWLYASGLTGGQMKRLQWSDVDLSARCLLTSKGVVRISAAAADALGAADGSTWDVFPGAYHYAVSRSAAHVISVVGETPRDLGQWSACGGAISEWCRRWLSTNAGVTRLTDLPAMLG